MQFGDWLYTFVSLAPGKETHIIRYVGIYAVLYVADTKQNSVENQFMLLQSQLARAARELIFMRVTRARVANAKRGMKKPQLCQRLPAANRTAFLLNVNQKRYQCANLLSVS